MMEIKETKRDGVSDIVIYLSDAEVEDVYTQLKQTDEMYGMGKRVGCKLPSGGSLTIIGSTTDKLVTLEKEI